MVGLVFMAPNFGLAKAQFAIKNKSSLLSVQAAPVVQYFQNANGGNSSDGFTVGGITFNADPKRAAKSDLAMGVKVEASAVWQFSRMQRVRFVNSGTYLTAVNLSNTEIESHVTSLCYEAASPRIGMHLCQSEYVSKYKFSGEQYSATKASYFRSTRRTHDTFSVERRAYDNAHQFGLGWQHIQRDPFFSKNRWSLNLRFAEEKENKLLEVSKFELGYQIPIKSPLSDQIRLYVGSTQAKGSKIFGIKRQIDTQKYGVTSSKKVLGVTVVLGVERSQKQSVIQGFGGDETKFTFQLSF